VITAGSKGTDPVVAIGDRLGSEIAQEIGRCRRPQRSDVRRP
jgi:hypothetical protein